MSKVFAPPRLHPLQMKKSTGQFTSTKENVVQKNFPFQKLLITDTRITWKLEVKKLLGSPLPRLTAPGGNHLEN